MYTGVDEKKGLVKTSWVAVRHRVKAVAPEFASIVDQLSPDKSYPLFLAYYPYGELKGDTISPFIPKVSGGNYRLSDKNIPEVIAKHLGYGKNDTPLGMVLEKCLEYYIDLKDLGITLPCLISKPGMIFPLARILNTHSNRVYAPNGLLTVSSGARSIFMLPNIGCLTNHVNLQRDFNIQLPPPKTLYEHWFLFRSIINSHFVNSEWRSCIIYFSEKWVKKINHDPSWMLLKNYILELGWRNSEYERNQFYYNCAYSLIQNKRNLKPNPYLADTASHLLTIAMGAVPAYIPAINEEAGPIKKLQEIFIDSYGLKKYVPTIMHPSYFCYESDVHPVYYSLQNPSTHIFSPKSRKISSTLFDMRELQHVLDIFINELCQQGNICADSIISEIAKNVSFDFFHNKNDRHHVIQHSRKLNELDARFNTVLANKESGNASFACDASFVRGCIRIKRIEEVKT